MSKSLFKSKALWLNVLGVAITFVPTLPIEPTMLVYVLAALNVGVRLLTVGPVHVLSDAAGTDRG